MSYAQSPGVRAALLYSQDNRGLGHITRTLTIARHLLAAHPDFVAWIVTRSKFAHNFVLPHQCDYVKLPSRKTPHTVERTPEHEEVSKVHFRTLRAQILRDVALGLGPDLVIVDHEPLGSSGEFRAGLWALKQQNPATKFIFGLRDIMDDPDRIRAAWRQMGVYEAFQDLYDGIAVYGSRALYDVAEAYDIPPSARSKLHYCGFIVRDPPPRLEPAKLREQFGLPPDGRLVLATVGSGYDGYPVLEAALTAIKQVQATHRDLVALVVMGPFMPEPEQALLQARADAKCRVILQADCFQLMQAADAVVSMGGYNSVCEALFSARPLVIVPRATHKIEQQIRAAALAARGLARWVHPKALNSDELVAALEWALQCDPEAHARLVRQVIPSFDGAARLTEYLSDWLRPEKAVEKAVESSFVCASVSNPIASSA